MQGEKEKIRRTTDGSGEQAAITPSEEQNPIGQDSARNEYGEIGEPAQPGSGSAPPRSLGTKGEEFGQFADHDRSGQQGQSGTGQADLGSQAGSTLSGHTDQQELGEAGGEVDQPASYTQGEGFILQQDESAATAKATEGTDFAAQGRGATEEEDEATSEGGIG
jgi:hypothetical protein